MMKRKLIVSLAAAIVVVNTGCTSSTTEINKLPTVSMLTEKEVIDYYAESLKYDAVVSRNVTVHKTVYETNKVSDEKYKIIQGYVTKAQEILKLSEYGESDTNIISENSYDYIKATIDGYSLSGGKVESITSALGYYFADVKYSIKSQDAGVFTGSADLMGLNGVWVTKADGTYEIDKAYLSTAKQRLNDYFVKNGIGATVEFNEATGELVMNYQGVTEAVSSKVNSYVDSTRKVVLDVNLINKVVGSSLNQSSFLPDLNLVYTKANASGEMSGFGIYPEGLGGLRQFGYKRAGMSGELTLRFVYKEDSNGNGTIVGKNVYCTKLEVNDSDIKADKEKVIIPNFLKAELGELIERADRVRVDCDLPGMMNGSIYEDKGVAILSGYTSSSSNVLKYMSTIKEVVSRDVANNMYLLKVENTVIDGAKDADTCGTYRDTYYITVQQQGKKLVINDSLRVSREMVTEPSISPDSAADKRLIALNLSGEVKSDSKSKIKELVSDLYTAGTNRILNGPKKLSNGSETITIEKGMYDCFDSDTEMLSSNNKEYINEELRSLLTSYGADVKSVYSGVITEWIGGYDNQAEFTTEELIAYDGTDEGHYMTVYYLVSNISGEWVIGERNVIDEKEVKGSELEEIQGRLK
jgi:hypothetical protein